MLTWVPFPVPLRLLWPRPADWHWPLGGRWGPAPWSASWADSPVCPGWSPAGRACTACTIQGSPSGSAGWLWAWWYCSSPCRCSCWSLWPRSPGTIHVHARPTPARLTNHHKRHYQLIWQVLHSKRVYLVMHFGLTEWLWHLHLELPPNGSGNSQVHNFVQTLNPIRTVHTKSSYQLFRSA